MVSTFTASGQGNEVGTWQDRIATASQALRGGYSAPLATVRPRGVATECSALFPTSVVLRSGLDQHVGARGGSGPLPTFHVLRGDSATARTREFLPPDATLSVPASVLRAECDAAGRPRFVVLRVDSFTVAYADSCTDCTGYPFLYATLPGEEESRLVWTAERRLVGEAAIAAAHHARAAAQLRMDSIEVAALLKQRLADRQALIDVYIASGWSRRFAVAAAEGRVLVGMAPEMVRSAWGSPSRVNRVTEAGLQVEMWSWTRRPYDLVAFRNGLVWRIEESSSR